MPAGPKPQIIGPEPDNYAGDVTPEEAWRYLAEAKDAVLVDVRTRAEWSFVGVPDLSPLHKEAVLVEWQSYPDMARNPRFESEVGEKLKELGIGGDAPIFFLCRSGGRSKAAAIALAARGYRACHNVAGGFEGDLDQEHHRARQNGWKVAGLPWRQS